MAIHPIPPPGADSGQDGPLPLPSALVRELRHALTSIRYGSIELIIHDGRCVQLERREKVRFDTDVTEHRR